MQILQIKNNIFIFPDIGERIFGGGEHWVVLKMSYESTFFYGEQEYRVNYKNMGREKGTG